MSSDDNSGDDTPGDAGPAVSRTKSRRKRGKKAAGARTEKRPKTADDPAVARTEMRASSDKIVLPRTKTPDAIALPRTKTPASAADIISLPRTMSEEWMAADVDDGAYEDDTRRPVWLIPALAAAVVTVGIVGIFALRGSDSETPPSVRQSPVPPAVTESAPSPVPDAAVVPAASPDAAELAPLDATLIASAPVDAVVVDAKPPADAAVVAVHTEPPYAAPKLSPVEHLPPPPKPPPPPPPKKDERSIEELVAASEFGKANTACADNTKFSTVRLEACAIAACQTHSTALAQRWVRALDRAVAGPTIDKCKTLGVELDAP